MFGKDDFLLAHSISELPRVLATYCECERGKKKQQQNNPQKPNKRTPKPNQKQPNLPPQKNPHNPKKETTKKHADLLLKNPKALTSPNLNKHKTKKWYFRRFCRTLSMLSLIMFCLKVLHQNKIIFFKRQNVEKTNLNLQTVLNLPNQQEVGMEIVKHLMKQKTLKVLHKISAKKQYSWFVFMFLYITKEIEPGVFVHFNIKYWINKNY